MFFFFYNGITYRIILGTKDEMVVKSGKFVIPVLEMLLWRKAAETDENFQEPDLENNSVYMLFILSCCSFISVTR